MSGLQRERSVKPERSRRSMVATLEAAQWSFESAGDRPKAVSRSSIQQAQGIEKAKTQGLYKGRKADTERHAAIAEMLDRGMSWSQVCTVTGASRSTVKRVVDGRKQGLK